MPKTPHPTPECFIYLLSKVYQKGHGLVQKRLKKFGLTNMQYVVLEHLWAREGQTLRETGEQLSIDKATLSGVIDRMAEGEWITKEKSNEDGRIIRLYPSEKSKKLKDRLVRERVKANDQLLSRYTLEERVLLRRLLLEMLR